MKPFENFPSPGGRPPEGQHGMTQDQIQAMRKKIQAELSEKKPEKQAEEALEKKTFKAFKAFVIPEPLKICNELYSYGIEIDGFQLDVKGAQEAFKKRNKILPVYPGTSPFIEELIRRKEVAHKKGSFSLIRGNNAMILTSDGKYFQVNVSISRQTLYFVDYTDEFFAP